MKAYYHKSQKWINRTNFSDWGEDCKTTPTHTHCLSSWLDFMAIFMLIMRAYFIGEKKQFCSIKFMKRERNCLFLFYFSVVLFLSYEACELYNSIHLVFASVQIARMDNKEIKINHEKTVRHRSRYAQSKFSQWGFLYN